MIIHIRLANNEPFVSCIVYLNSKTKILNWLLGSPLPKRKLLSCMKTYQAIKLLKTTHYLSKELALKSTLRGVTLIKI